MKRPAMASGAVPAPSYGAASYSAPSYGSGPSYSPPAAAPALAPPPAPPAPRVPPPPSAETLDEDVGEFAEDDVLAEGELDNDGPDFAMSFAGSTAPPKVSPAALMNVDEERESTLLGSTDPSMVPPPVTNDWDRSPPRSTATVVDDEDADEYNAADKTPT